MSMTSSLGVKMKKLEEERKKIVYVLQNLNYSIRHLRTGNSRFVLSFSKTNLN